MNELISVVPSASPEAGQVQDTLATLYNTMRCTGCGRASFTLDAFEADPGPVFFS